MELLNNINFIYSCIIGYFIGSVPFGLILTKFFLSKDIRDLGSGNIGATNVLRTGNKKIAFLTLLLDILKGIIPIYILNLFVSYEIATISGLFAVLGHCFPLWLYFKGGKGVATCVGVIFALDWIAGLLFILLWFLIAYFSRISSLAAIISLCLTTLYVFCLSFEQTFIIFGISIICISRHYENISRLLKGKENKIKFK